jgi:hypothetical protein
MDPNNKAWVLIILIIALASCYVTYDNNRSNETIEHIRRSK